ncbi:MAG: HesA/MoeB/ThiF family protein [Bacteroidales bacterium]|nr:HesA/MoeB/ThiF family protein [Bacteroidales bacterium]
MDTTQLNKAEYLRYNRQMILPEIGTEGQLKLKNAKVLVIGAGGLGCPILMYLAAAGVGTIGIVDYDQVDLSNLHRQVLYSTDDIGKNKVEVTTLKISRLNPEINVIPYPLKLSKENVLDILKDYDIIIDGSDNFPTRFLVADATVILNKPLVFGAVYQFMGQASVFNYKNGPTYRCLFPEQPKVGEAPSCNTAGVMGVLPGIIGSIQANETLKIILDIGETLAGKLFQINTLNFKVELIDVEQDKNLPKIKALGEYDIDCHSNIKSLDPHDFDSNFKLKDFLIYDLRPPHQFEMFNIGGINISSENLLNSLGNISKNEKILVVCQIGEQSAAIVDYLQNKQDFNKVYNLSKGINKWLNK